MALCLLFAIALDLCFFYTSAELERFDHPAKSDGSLSFLVVGDWGRRGAFNQSQVASQVLFSDLLHHVCVCEIHLQVNDFQQYRL